MTNLEQQNIPTCNVVPYRIDDTNQIEVTQIKDDVWLTQKQMALLFDTDRSVITKHLKNIFESHELNEKEVCAKNALFDNHTSFNCAKDYIATNYYNLDAIISVGYRVNSKRGVKFRQWATQIIKDRIKQEYTQTKSKEIENNITNQVMVCNSADLNDVLNRIKRIEKTNEETIRIQERIDELLKMTPQLNQLSSRVDDIEYKLNLLSPKADDLKEVQDKLKSVVKRLYDMLNSRVDKLEEKANKIEEKLKKAKTVTLLMS